MKWLALGFVFALGCASAPTPAPPPVEEAPGDDVREAVFRYLFAHNASEMGDKAEVYCLEIEDKKDPSAGFLTRFSQNTPPAVMSSDCDRDPAHGVHSRSLGKKGLVFNIEAIRKQGPDSAEVDAGYYEAGLSASGETLTLERQNGVWVVTADRRRWIS
ncbi:MAG: hypothetical protein U1E65_20175 [Myxococcota bacterium]